MVAQRSEGDRISQLLREIRGEHSQTSAATLTGWTQSSVSRGENGRFTPSPEEADAYARTLRASARTRRELVSLVKAAQSQQITGQARLWRAGPAIQHKIGQLERQSRLVRAWQPELIPGLLQTWDYTLAVVGPDPGRKWIQHRRERVARLDDTRFIVHMLLSEAALRWAIGSRDTMAAQCQRLIELGGRSNVRIGVLPFGPILPPAPPSFDLYQDRTVVVETHTGVQFLDDQTEVKAYIEEFERLDAHALHDDGALERIAQVAVSYQGSD